MYVEPFFGSGAVLLARETPCRREVVCDLDGHVANFWRAMAADPEAVARYADYPTIHQDLTARHRWLVSWARENRERLSEDPFFYCPLAAGWWAWGKSNWIGAGWCDGAMEGSKVSDAEGEPYDARPSVAANLGSSRLQTEGHKVRNGSYQGVPFDKRPQLNTASLGTIGCQVPGKVQDKRPSLPDKPADGRGVQSGRRPAVQATAGGIGVSAQTRAPIVGSDPGGRGVQAQRVTDQIPALSRDPGGGEVQAQRVGRKESRPAANDHPMGHGVQVQRGAITRDGRPATHGHPTGAGVQVGRISIPGAIGSGDRLLPWFLALQQRLSRLVILNRDWRSAVTPSILSATKSTNNRYTQAIFMDPPYLAENRTSGIYAADDSGEVARAAYEWAVEHGDRYRIAYASSALDFPVPEGWDAEEMPYPSVTKRNIMDRVIFSPACLPAARRSLFEEAVT